MKLVPREALPEKLTYERVLAEYRRVLKENPGYALNIGRYDKLAVLIDNEPRFVYFGQPEIHEFSKDQFNAAEGCWNSETPELTMSQIRHPRIVGFSAEALLSTCDDDPVPSR
jgi:hypothetical protein